MGAILFLPLDDRPCNRLHPAGLLEAAGNRVLSPPRSWLGRFLSPGRPLDFPPWLRARAGQAQHLLVSLEMLCYGGLLGSRSPSLPAPEAISRLEILAELKRAFPDLRIWASNIITRLSTTVTDASALPPWRKIFAYSILWGKQQAAPSPEQQAELEARERDLPAPLLASYRAYRQRNHAVNLAALDLVAAGVVEYLVLGQEDAAPFGPHRLEQARLRAEISRRGLEERVTLLDGADEIGALLAGRVLAEDGWPVPRLTPVFHYPAFRRAVLPYEDLPLETNWERHLAVLGPATGPEVTCFVHHPPAAHPLREENDLALLAPPPPDPPDDFSREITSRLERGDRVALLDVRYANGADPGLLARLSPREHISRLLAFSAWNTGGNSIGTLQAETLLAASLPSRDFSPWLWYHYLDDYLYQSVVRPALARDLAAAGLDSWNLGSHHPRWSRETERRLRAAAASRYRPRDFTCFLPWPRTFEVEIRFR